MRRVLASLIVAMSMLMVGQQQAVAASTGQPDLGMARLTDLVVTTTVDGRKQLRFSATIVNVGANPFQIVASRSDSGSGFAVAQRVHNGDGTWTDSAVSATLVFAGDGHGHWHVRDLETYSLHRLDTGATVGNGAKGGYCFMDTTAYRLSLPGAPQQPRYTDEGCGEQSSTQLSMGLSVGWGDRYGWTLSDQYVDITGIATGKYRLRAVADAFGQFTESGRANNETWVDFSLSARRGGLQVKVLGYGPSA